MKNRREYKAYCNKLCTQLKKAVKRHDFVSIRQLGQAFNDLAADTEARCTSLRCSEGAFACWLSAFSDYVADTGEDILELYEMYQSFCRENQKMATALSEVTMRIETYMND